jgi:hypothetical protein
MYVPFHGGSNDITCYCARPRRLEISLSSHGGVLVLAMWFTVLQKEQTSVVTTVYRWVTSDNIFPQFH